MGSQFIILMSKSDTALGSEPSIGHNLNTRAKERKESMRKRVAKAVASCLNHTSVLGTEPLSLGVGLVDCGFVPGLSGVARRLLKVWRTIEQVRVNEVNALRLVGRCTDIFECIKADISRNGDRVPAALELPIQRLEDTLDVILQCMAKHIRQALILQYLRRNSISRDISYCGSLLDDAMTLINFGLGLSTL